jgi:hypothetical protein
VTLRVEIEGRGALKRLQALPERVRKVAAAATNRALRSVRAELVRQVRQQAALPAAYVREQYALQPAAARDLSGAITARKRGILLTRFPHRQLYLPKDEGRKRRRRGEKRIKRGVSVTVKPGIPKVMRGGFLIGLRSGLTAGGRQGIAVRVGKGRSAIRVLHGPSPSQMFQTLLPDLQKHAGGVYRREMTRALGVALRATSEPADE